MHHIRLIYIITLFGLSPNLLSQVDSSYIQSFEKDFAVKLYTVDKINGFTREVGEESFLLRTNNPISLGVGVSWKNMGLSFSNAFGFLRDKNKGKTESLEFQYHGYTSKLTYDIFLQHHQGFYEDHDLKNRIYNIYPDIQLNMHGGSMHYVWNNKHFSYKAAFNQSERQLKSSGSLLTGVSLYYSRVRSDSTIIFEKMQKNHENLQFGISAGYIYTWVIDRQWSMTGALTLGASIGNNHLSKFFKNKMEIYPSGNGRFAVGYNNKDWFVGTSFLYNRTYLFFDGNTNLSMDNGQIQLSVTRRFNWGNKSANSLLNKTNSLLNSAKSKVGLQGL